MSDKEPKRPYLDPSRATRTPRPAVNIPAFIVNVTKKAVELVVVPLDLRKKQ